MLHTIRALNSPGVVLSLVFSATGPLSAQVVNGPRFEVASVRKAAPPPAGSGVRDGVRGGPGTSDPSQVTYTSLRLKDLLLTAYGVNDYQISGPDWLDTERYDIAAKIPLGTSKEQFAVMLQALLTERFQLNTHHETREQTVYALVVAKGGPKLKPWVSLPGAPAPPASNPGAPPAAGKDGFPVVQPGHFAMTARNGHLYIAARKLPLARLANSLARQLGRPVLDRTGLTGEYDYRLEFSTDGLTAGIPAGPPQVPDPTIEHDAASLFTALEEQLGLKLERKKSPVDMLIVDHAERDPIQN